MRGNRGFSLLELIVVIVLIAATTALAAGVMTRGLAGQQLRNSSRELAAQLRYARAQAIVTGQPALFTINARTREWRGPNRRHGQVPREIKIVASGARVEQSQSDQAVIRFFPEGAATGGRILLSRERAGWQIDVEWLTGEVTVKRAQGDP